MMSSRRSSPSTSPSSAGDRHSADGALPVLKQVQEEARRRNTASAASSRTVEGSARIGMSAGPALLAGAASWKMVD
jgi:hypothetical protein